MKLQNLLKIRNPTLLGVANCLALRLLSHGCLQEERLGEKNRALDLRNMYTWLDNTLVTMNPFALLPMNEDGLMSHKQVVCLHKRCLDVTRKGTHLSRTSGLGSRRQQRAPPRRW